MIKARFAKQLGGFSLEIEFEANPGVTVLYGQSGAGKTLTLECLAGFVNPDSGRILLSDQILFDAGVSVNLPPQKRACGYVFQDHSLFPHMTLWQNLAFAAEHHPRLERHRRVSEMLERFRIGDFARKYPSQVSGGQKQRCSIARALIAEPKMLLLDEPARGLDLILRNELYNLVGQIRLEYRIPIVLVTHDLAECFALGDTMLVMEGGRVMQAGEPMSIYNRPASAKIAGLLGIANLLEAEILALDPGRNTSRVRVLGQEISATYFPGLLRGDYVQLAIPAAQVKVRDTGGQNRIPRSVNQVTEFADSVRLEFEPAITAEIAREEYLGLRGAQEVYIELPPAALRLAR